MSTNLDALITNTPGVRHGRPCIAGTGITVHRIAILYKLGYSPDEIVRKYEHLDAAGVYAALAYYHANQDEVDAEIAADEADSDRVEADFLQKRDVA
jgi:uncharacterized protein (DUF433 family)